MRRVVLQIGLILVLIVFALPARAGLELINVERPMHAHTLAGFVQAPAGEFLPGVLIEEYDSTFKHVLASTTTDAHGHFAFPKTKIGTTHYLSVKLDEFNPMHITVKLWLFAHAQLHIKLEFST